VFADSAAMPEKFPKGRTALAMVIRREMAALRYIDNLGVVANAYPANPNGSPDGLAGVTTADGRFTIMMPHPERIIRTAQMSWHPRGWGEDSPWLNLFRNARRWLA
jgi:phosphoribosylformylglycinamidine synthase